jgi:hypothetical protein
MHPYYTSQVRVAIGHDEKTVHGRSNCDALTRSDVGHGIPLNAIKNTPPGVPQVGRAWRL